MDAAISVVLFSGKPKDWLAWMDKFLAETKRKNLKHIYLMDLNKITMASELENLDPMKDADKARMRWQSK
jgi:hypothetical protein